MNAQQQYAHYSKIIVRMNHQAAIFGLTFHDLTISSAKIIELLQLLKDRIAKFGDNAYALPARETRWLDEAIVSMQAFLNECLHSAMGCEFVSVQPIYPYAPDFSNQPVQGCSNPNDIDWDATIARVEAIANGTYVSNIFWDNQDDGDPFDLGTLIR